jgi:hypothetical protein
VVTLYVETNLPMSIAMGRDADALRLLSNAGQSYELIIPAACLMESLSAFQRERSVHNEFAGRLQQRAGQLRRNLLSGSAVSMLSHVEQAEIEAGRLLNDMQVRLVQALQELCRSATVLPVDPTLFASSLTTQHLKQMTDNLILHMILADAPARPSEHKALVTGNTNDFTDPQIVQLLNSAGIEEVFATAGDALQWVSRSA